MSQLFRLIPAGWGLITAKISIAAVAFGLGWWQGAASSDRSAEIRQLNSQITSLRHDLSIARRAEEISAIQADTIRVIIQKNKEKVDALTADLERIAQERRSCALTEPQRRRLLDIR